MNWMIITGVVYAILIIKHILQKPDLYKIGTELASLWFYQLWFYTFIMIFLFVSSTFYELFKGAILDR